MKTQVDRVILTKLLDGDMSYFDEFYNKTKQEVFYNILAILKDPTLSEDALQETYVKFLENRDKLKADDNILGYLFTISRNISLDIIKKRKREIAMDDYQEESIKSVDKKDDLELLLKRMKKILKDKEFQIVIMHILNDMTHQEIAKSLNKPLGTITWAYNNALKKLRKGLEDYE